MSLGYWETLATMQGASTALTAAARASALQGAKGKTGLYTLPANKLRIGDVLHLRAQGMISCVVTTPGTARFDLSAGVAGTAFMDTLAILLNIVAKTSVPFILDMQGTVQVAGNVAQLFWQGFWLSEASINTAVQITGPGPGGAVLPWNVAPPVLGTAFDNTIANIIDFNFTQTAATGSMTLNTYRLALETSTGF
jgi:hypothetical protein